VRLTPTHDGNEATDAGPPHRSWLARPALKRIVTAGVGLFMTAVASVLLLVPAVFYLLPIPQEADAATLCLPGIGPLQRFREDLRAEQEEQTYIHESVHAAQCRSLGATSYARRAATPAGRLILETEALCAEVAFLTKRGGDRERLLAWTVETLETEYFDGASLRRRDIVAAVEKACDVAMWNQASHTLPGSALTLPEQ